MGNIKWTATNIFYFIEKSQLRSSLDQANFTTAFYKVSRFFACFLKSSFCSTSELDEVGREAKKTGKTGSHNLLFFLNAATLLT